jgi:adenine phosphoribosyltransferase
VENLSALVRDIPDFPEPGIVFKDITPVLADPAAFKTLIEALAGPFRDSGVTKIAGIEARGFTLATPVAGLLEAGFIPIRKPGKLPYETVREDYALEYGTDSLEIHTDAARPAAAAIKLLRKIGADVVGISVFIELAFLNGAQMLDGVPLNALITYD